MMNISCRSHGVQTLFLSIGILCSAPATATPYTCHFGKGDRTVVSVPFELDEGQVKDVSYTRTNLSEAWRDYLEGGLGISEIHNYFNCHQTNQERWTADRAQAGTQGRKEEIIKFNPFGAASVEWAKIQDLDRDGGAEAKRQSIGGPAHANSGKAAPPAPARSKYVDVSGPDGRMMRLSPEVAARNEAAAKDYNRKLQEHADAVARAETEHSESLARHAEGVAKAAAAQREFEQRAATAKQKYEQQLADHAVKLAATKTAASGGGTSTTTAEKDRIFKATSMAFDTKDRAMAYLSSLRLPPFFEVQCNQQKFFTPPKWSCTGHYRQTVTRSSTSKQ